jgi:two-component system NtrC family sensor kinase
MLYKAIRLCEAAFGFLTTYDGQQFKAAAQISVPTRLADYFAAGMDQPQPGDSHWRLLGGENLVHNLDQMDEEAYRSGNPLRRAVVELGGARTALVVALRKDKALLGAFTIYRKEVRAFTYKQIALVENFAAQAVIAIENARLVTETREALEQQTATAEVLQVINSSPGDLAPVFDAMLDKALRLCNAAFGCLFTYDADAYHTVSARGLPPEFAEIMRQPLPPGPGTAALRVARGEPFVHIADLTEDTGSRPGNPMRWAMIEMGRARTQLTVPLRKESALLGMFVIWRREVQPFSDKQIALL